MRSSLSWFMVALLVLRGLLGNAVAMELQPPATPPAATASSHAHHGAPTLAVTTDVTAMAAMPAIASHHTSMAHCPDADAPTSGHCSQAASDSTCSSCLMCHTPACTTQLPAPFTRTAPTSRPAESVAALASAPLRSPIKPPIA